MKPITHLLLHARLERLELGVARAALHGLVLGHHTRAVALGLRRTLGHGARKTLHRLQLASAVRHRDGPVVRARDAEVSDGRSAFSRRPCPA